MKNNKGFSLIELIVTVAVIALMGSFVFLTIGMMTGQDARECANNISSVLDKEKNYALAKSAEVDCYVDIKLESDGYYAEYYVPQKAVGTGTVLSERQEIGKGSVLVTCYSNSGGSPTLIGTMATGDRLRLAYDRVSGAFKVASLNGTTGVDFDTIQINKGRTYRIELYSATGKHTLSRSN